MGTLSHFSSDYFIINCHNIRDKRYFQMNIPCLDFIVNFIIFDIPGFSPSLPR